jgi:glycosyltransferase involved in cell wall biosynthesis
MLTKKRETSPTLHEVSNYVPARVLEIELGQPLLPLSDFDEKTGHYYKRALCLIRLHTQPLGVIELQLDESETSAYKYAQRIWNTFAEKINAHLQQDGLPLVTGLDTPGLYSSSTPHCIEERNRFFADAPFVSVIVSTHERPEQLQQCLRSLASLHYPEYEIIVIDNAPVTNATADLIQQTYRDVPWVRYIREDRPGASWARNRGIMAAQGEILAFTDDDVVVDPCWLIELVRAFSIADDVACVTGLTMPLELETPAQFWFEEYGEFSKNVTPRIFDMAEYHPKMPLHPYTAGQFGSGVSTAFTAAFLESVNGFDPALGPGVPARAGEDLALFFQAVMHGHKLVYAPASLLYHLHRREYASLRQQIYNYGVGLSAYLTKSLFDNPRLIFDLITKVPYGLYFSLSDRSPRNNKKSTHYPGELTRLELEGLLYGPLAYIQGCRTRRHELLSEEQ